jgi:hypothetical protein
MFIVFLIAAAIVGLTFVACRRPSSFEALRPATLAICFAAACALSAWSLASLVTLAAVAEYIPPERFGQAAGAAKKAHVVAWWAFAMAGVTLYLAMLRRFRRAVFYAVSSLSKSLGVKMPRRPPR